MAATSVQILKEHGNAITTTLIKVRDMKGRVAYSANTMKRTREQVSHTLKNVYGCFLAPADIVAKCPMSLMCFLEGYVNPSTRERMCRSVCWYIAEHRDSDFYRVIRGIRTTALDELNLMDKNKATEKDKLCTHSLEDLRAIAYSRFCSTPDKPGRQWIVWAAYYAFAPPPRNDLYKLVFCEGLSEDECIERARDGANIYCDRTFYFGNSKSLNGKRNRGGQVAPLMMKVNGDPRFVEMWDWLCSLPSEERSINEHSSLVWIKKLFGDQYNITQMRRKWATESVSNGIASDIVNNAKCMMHSVSEHVGVYAYDKDEDKENVVCN
jgi:hypothetical protein